MNCDFLFGDVILGSLSPPDSDRAVYFCIVIIEHTHYSARSSMATVALRFIFSCFVSLNSDIKIGSSSSLFDQILSKPTAVLVLQEKTPIRILETQKHKQGKREGNMIYLTKSDTQF